MIQFANFCIKNPEIPSDENELVNLIDEDTQVVNIYNITLKTARAIVRGLDSVLQRGKSDLMFRGAESAIDFHILLDHDNYMSINGRYIEDNGQSSYCHDFEIENISLEDWESLKAELLK